MKFAGALAVVVVGMLAAPAMAGTITYSANGGNMYADYVLATPSDFSRAGKTTNPLVIGTSFDSNSFGPTASAGALASAHAKTWVTLDDSGFLFTGIGNASLVPAPGASLAAGEFKVWGRSVFGVAFSIDQPTDLSVVYSLTSSMGTDAVEQHGAVLQFSIQEFGAGWSGSPTASTYSFVEGDSGTANVTLSAGFYSLNVNTYAVINPFIDSAGGLSANGFGGAGYSVTATFGNPPAHDLALVPLPPAAWMGLGLLGGLGLIGRLRKRRSA